MELEEFNNLFNYPQSADKTKKVYPDGIDRRNFRRKCAAYSITNGTLHYKHKVHGSVRVIKIDEKQRILEACHSSPASGHLGANKTSTKITTRYFWPGVHNDIKEYIGNCDKCQRANRLHKAPAVLHPVPVPDRSFHQFGMDLVGPLKTTSNGNQYIIVMTDYLTKWPEAEAIQSKEAIVIAKFITKMLCRYSSMKVIITDQGREFCNAINEEICNRLGIDHRRTTAYHPQSNGQCERYNGTLCASLVKYVNSEQNDWDEFIDPWLLAYRTSANKSTSKTPFFLTYGKEPTLLVEEDFPVGEQPAILSDQEALDVRVEAVVNLLKHQKEAQSMIGKAQAKHKEYFDRKHDHPSYFVGQAVLLNNARRQQRKGDKMTPRWTGPHDILEIRENGVVRLEGHKALCNVLRIKPYRQAPASPAVDCSTTRVAMDPQDADGSSLQHGDTSCDVEITEEIHVDTIPFSPVNAIYGKSSVQMH